MEGHACALRQGRIVKAGYSPSRYQARPASINLGATVKKKEVEMKHVEGWTGLTGVRSYCRNCGHLIDFDNVAYWRKVGDRTVINCVECVGK